MSADEKKAHLAALQEKLKEKRAKQAELDKEETKRNEVRLIPLSESQEAAANAQPRKSARKPPRNPKT